jgi:hypothetical protein
VGARKRLLSAAAGRSRGPSAVASQRAAAVEHAGGAGAWGLGAWLTSGTERCTNGTKETERSTAERHAGRRRALRPLALAPAAMDGSSTRVSTVWRTLLYYCSIRIVYADLAVGSRLNGSEAAERYVVYCRSKGTESQSC